MANYLIIGSTSGIGAALSRMLMDDGHTVYAINRRPTAQATHSFCADVTIDPLPGIDVPLNGIAYCPGSIQLKPFRALKQDDILKGISVNVLGAIRVLQHYLPNLQKAEQCAIVLFSTVAVTTGMPYHASIAIAKGAIEGLTRSLAAEWAPKIRVNCIAPSLTNTPLAAKLLDNESKQAAAANRHPLKTIASATDIANSAHHLLTDRSRFITGQVWQIDGGLSSLRVQ